MRRIVCRWLVPAILIGVLVGPARADEAAPAKPVFMWEIKSPTATVYLLGSVHAAKPGLYPLDDRITKAYETSDALVVEANVAGPAAMGMAGEMLAKAAYPAGQTLKDQLPADLYTKTSQAMARCSMSLEMFQGFKPWFLAMTLSMAELTRAGIDPNKGIDLHFLGQASKQNKPILELEGAAAQVAMLAGMTPQEQELFLSYTLKDIDELAQHMDEMMTAWQAGDAGKLNEFIVKSVKEAPELAPVFKRLFDERNAKMAAKIETYLGEKGTKFVVVGAGHLVGETGLVKQLGKNHKVQQL